MSRAAQVEPCLAALLLRGDAFLNLSNFSGASQRFTLPAGEWRNSLDGSVLAGTVGLQPWHMLWLEREQS